MSPKFTLEESQALKGGYCHDPTFPPTKRRRYRAPPAFPRHLQPAPSPFTIIPTPQPRVPSHNKSPRRPSSTPPLATATTTIPNHAVPAQQGPTYPGDYRVAIARSIPRHTIARGDIAPKSLTSATPPLRPDPRDDHRDDYPRSPGAAPTRPQLQGTYHYRAPFAGTIPSRAQPQHSSGIPTNQQPGTLRPVRRYPFI